MVMEINKELIDGLFEQAQVNPRLRQNYDLRTSERDHSQRMINALLPGTVVLSTVIRRARRMFSSCVGRSWR